MKRKKPHLRILPREAEPEIKLDIWAETGMPKILRPNFARRDVVIEPIPPRKGSMDFVRGDKVTWQMEQWPSDTELLMRTIPEIGPGPFKVADVDHGGTLACHYKVDSENGKPKSPWLPHGLFKEA